MQITMTGYSEAKASPPGFAGIAQIGVDLGAGALAPVLKQLTTKTTMAPCGCEFLLGETPRLGRLYGSGGRNIGFYTKSRLFSSPAFSPKL